VEVAELAGAVGDAEEEEDVAGCRVGGEGRDAADGLAVAEGGLLRVVGEEGVNVGTLLGGGEGGGGEARGSRGRRGR